jgi:hypothetical protein
VHLYIDTIFFDKGTAAGEKRLIKGTSKNSFLLRMAAISSGGVVRPKFVLDIALAMPAAILTFRQSREDFARSRNKSNF